MNYITKACTLELARSNAWTLHLSESVAKSVRRAGGRVGRQMVCAKEVYLKQKRRSSRPIGPSYFPVCLVLKNNGSHLHKKQSQKSYKTMPCFMIRTTRLTSCLQLQMCQFGFRITLKQEHKTLNIFYRNYFFVFPWALFVYYTNFFLLFLSKNKLLEAFRSRHTIYIRM